MNIYEKLQYARVQLQEKKVKKSGKNKFAGFEYYELTDIIPPINVIFNELKMSSIFKMDSQTAFLTIINSEKPEETIEFTTPTAELELKGCNAIQALGGINTYCRRYLYLNALEIVENDMFDSTSGKENLQKNKQEVKKLKEENKIPINSDLDIITGLEAIEDIENVRKYYSENIKNVTDKDAFIEACKRRKEAIGTKEAELLY